MIKKLMMIDDDPIYRFGSEHLIRSFSSEIELLTFNNGLDAIEFLSDMSSGEMPDLILLDLNMPVMDGWEVLEQLRQTTCIDRTSIFICSSSIDPSDIERAKQHCLVTDYLVKPLRKEILEKIIRQSYKSAS
jgi:CheY-like chemotaxis protein